MQLIACLALLAVPLTPTEESRALCEKFLAENQVIGFSAAVMKDGKVLFSQGFGWADSARRMKASEKTIYRLGSISKPVTATAALALWQDGKLNLDADLRTIVPEIKGYEWAVTPRQIMTHTSGIRHYTLTSETGITKEMTSGEAIGLFVKSPLLFPPGTKRSYSTHAWTVLAAAMERREGKRLAEIVSQRVSKPAGAKTLACEDRTKPNTNRTELYAFAGKEAKVSRPIENNSWKYAGGGMESTALDLARFCDAFRRGKIVRPETVKEMWRVQDGLPEPMGLGWMLPGNGQAIHGGAQQGCRCHARIDQKTGLVVVVMTNSNPAQNSPPALTDLILKAWQKAAVD